MPWVDFMGLRTPSEHGCRNPPPWRSNVRIQLIILGGPPAAVKNYSGRILRILFRGCRNGAKVPWESSTAPDVRFRRSSAPDRLSRRWINETEVESQGACEFETRSTAGYVSIFSWKCAEVAPFGLNERTTCRFQGKFSHSLLMVRFLEGDGQVIYAIFQVCLERQVPFAKHFHHADVRKQHVGHEPLDPLAAGQTHKQPV